jgi:8-oxo-dGTP pyrophosphatase MutT (NUDIX family)
MAARVKAMPARIPDDARASAVLCLLFPVAGELNVLLIKRMADKGAHSGQISFPGGRQDATDADLKATALREANEEVGIVSSDINILGALTPLYIPVSNFLVYPYVGYTPQKPDYRLSVNEVAYVIELPLNTLFHEARKTMVDVTSPAMPAIIRNVKAYKIEDDTVIWGATAMILSELEVIMDEHTRM